MRSRLLLASLFGLVALPLVLLPPSEPVLEQLAVEELLRGLRDADPPLHIEGLALHWPASSPTERAAQRDAIRSAWGLSDLAAPSSTDPWIPVLEGQSPRLLTVQIAPAMRTACLLREDGSLLRQTVLGSRRSLFPPLLAILLAFALRKTIPALGLGVLLGGFLLVPAGHSWTQVGPILVGDILIDQILADEFHVLILGFVFLLSSAVGVLTRMGGLQGLVLLAIRFVRGPRSAQFVAYGLGLAIFFDDYANTVVVGSAAGPLFDRHGISRARLAYVVDSTAAPVAGVAFLSTWVAYQVSTFAPQLPAVGMDPGEGYSLFLETIPYRFYCLLALFFVPLTIFTQREFGPMLSIERRARAGACGPAAATNMEWAQVDPAEGATPRWWNGAIPLLVLVGGTVFLLLFDGHRKLLAMPGDADAAAALKEGGFHWVRAVLAQTDSSRAIFFGALSALLAASILAVAQRILSLKETVTTALRGLGTLLPACAILLLAWAIGKVCAGLGTAHYLVALFQDLLAPGWLPLALFGTACFVAFATGSSWSTMAILQPNVVLLADRLGEGHALGSHGLLVLSIGAVLEGAIFGDHCSPISDTTILSSAASRTDHIDHVRTQMPYALLVAGVGLALGYLPVALFDLGPTAALAMSAAALVVALRLLGRKPLPAATAEDEGGQPERQS